MFDNYTYMNSGIIPDTIYSVVGAPPKELIDYLEELQLKNIRLHRFNFFANYIAWTYYETIMKYERDFQMSVSEYQMFEIKIFNIKNVININKYPVLKK